MKNKLTILALFCLALTIVTTVRTRSASQQQAAPPLQGSKPGSLQWVADQAKARGQQEISVPTGAINEYGVALNVNEALAHSRLVVATLVSKKSFAESDYIKTWYKFKIIETLHRGPKRGCPSCQVSLTPPDEMLPLGDDEFLILKDGGTIIFDGIKITSYDPNFPDLALSRRYMLFISPDLTAKAQAPEMGPFGIYAIDDNDAIEPIIKRADYPLGKDVKARLGSSLSIIRANVKTVVTP